MEKFIILAMIFCHIINDLGHQQRVLVDLKKKSFWETNAPETMYKHDNKAALMMHGMSWSFMIMLPVFLYYDLYISSGMLAAYIINAIAHAVVDDLVINRKKINMIIDQIIHLAQIIITAMVL